MQSFKDFIRGKRVTVMGLGLLGRGVGDVRFLAEMGARVTVTDKKTEAELARSIGTLKDISGITYHLGGHIEKDFTDTDLVLKAPATSLDSVFIQQAFEARVPVSMSSALAVRFAHDMGVFTVGVTGTRGKSTVTYMIHHVLTHYTGKRVHLGGNIRGVSTLALLPQLASGDILLMELDSWQLQGFGYERLSPRIAVFTSFSPDHRNYYADEVTYFADKANIFAFQKKSLPAQAGDELIVHPSLRQRVVAAHPPVPPVVPAGLDPQWQLIVPGEHNRDNAALAQTALRVLGVSDDVIKEGLMSFLGVEGRLEYMGEKHGVKIYNDNNATTPTATVAALNALRGQSVVLIAGGTDKDLPTDELIEALRMRAREVFLLSGSGTDKILPFVPHAHVGDNFEELVARALRSTRPGETLLFSPAFTSFGHFSNEYERNDTFKKVIASL